MLPDLLAAPPPAARASLGPVVVLIVQTRRAVLDYHDLVLTTQAEESAHLAAQIEQTQQTVGALVRELNMLLEQVKKVQGIDDQLVRVLADLRGQA